MLERISERDELYAMSESEEVVKWMMKVVTWQSHMH